jgi:hypothetical protein
MKEIEMKLKHLWAALFIVVSGAVVATVGSEDKEYRPACWILIFLIYVGFGLGRLAELIPDPPSKE